MYANFSRYAQIKVVNQKNVELIKYEIKLLPVML